MDERVPVWFEVVDEANTENLLVNFFDPHCGQTPLSWDDRTNNSNSLSHSQHVYSYNGIMMAPFVTVILQ